MSELTEERALVRPISRKLRLDLLTQRIVLVAVFVGIWWLSSLSVPHYILPGPARVWEALQLIVRNGDLWSNLGITFWRVTIGFVFAALVGLPFGIVLGANKRAGDSGTQHSLFSNLGDFRHHLVRHLQCHDDFRRVHDRDAFDYHQRLARY